MIFSTGGRTGTRAPVEYLKVEKLTFLQFNDFKWFSKFLRRVVLTSRY